MSAKLDQSLDEILSGSRRVSGKGGRRPRRAPATGRTAPPTAPVGGVKKTTRSTSSQIVPTGPAARGDSRIQVSGLPKDVSEAQIKEYFGKSVGPIKRVEISYGPGGVSRGIATISFAHSDGAKKATQALNGLLVDGKPMKIDVIIDAASAASIPPPKTLGDRIAAPKAQPKSAASTKTTGTAAGTRGGKASTRGRGRGGRGARPVKKTAEELDSEMKDYFESNAAGAEATNGAQPAGDAAMDDEIL